MIGKIAAVRVADEKTLEIRWDDGQSGAVDLEPIIRAHDNLAPLLDPAEFARVRQADDGWSIEWPCGIDFGAPQLRMWAKMRTPEETGA
ncbi:MAG: DUF2442 domain-containing protein [Alphaproteobacteria bacterium]|nr:DUF2442 domain-containing protein [Alphaproteobacteria bacterium]